MPAPKKKFGVITIDKPMGGLIQTPTGTNSAFGSLSASIEGETNQYAESNCVDLFRLEKLGHIAPSLALAAVTDSGNRITGLALNSVVASTTSAYFILNNARVVRSTDSSNGASIDANYDVTLANGHAAHNTLTGVNSDILLLKDAASSPTEYILWSWSDNVDADVTSFKVSDATQTDNWFSTLSGSGVLSKGVPLKMTQGPDGNIYITNGQYIASAVMAKGVALTSAVGNTQALNLGAGWTATGIGSYQNYIVIIGNSSTATFATTSRGKCRVWLWDGFSPDPNFVYDIHDNVANGIFVDGSDLYAFTSGRNNIGRISRFNSSQFVPEFEHAALYSGAVIQGGMDKYKDSIFINPGGTYVLQYAKNTLHKPLSISDGTNVASASAMFKNLFQGFIFMGVTLSGPAYKIYYSSSFTTYLPQSTFKSRLISLPHRAAIKKVRLYFSQFGPGASLQVAIIKDYDGVTFGGGTDVLKGSIAYSTTGAIRDYPFERTIPNINSFYLALNFNHASISNTAAIVRKIEVWYEITDNP